ncbi:hypothetical protein K503DRAFT_595852 [Rhizopogon vinicolor AM-OR11-026]|uniref:Uncharacterized protein n=1 Tax=Rhizopogon vinicolor AM-OR11-026 TaxID=1314800 RepID=A0A1B7MJ26_9AGAM|nr:hypothetical protein K503DRAFT_595852 [Rhizopogon vinicolor AM-OR11-026]
MVSNPLANYKVHLDSVYVIDMWNYKLPGNHHSSTHFIASSSTTRRKGELVCGTGAHKLRSIKVTSRRSTDDPSVRRDGIPRLSSDLCNNSLDTVASCQAHEVYSGDMK